MLQFFEMFWPKKNLKRIYRETNRYATEEYEFNVHGLEEIAKR
jgi:hypothetical protein